MASSWLESGVVGYNFERDLPSDHSIKLNLIKQVVQDEKILNDFLIRLYVKLRSVEAILVDGGVVGYNYE